MRRTRHAFTIIELTMAIAITAITGLSIAGVAVTISNAYASSSDTHQTLQAGQSVIRNIQAIINKTKLVTSVSKDGIVLWCVDSNEDGQINPSELVALYYDPQNRQLRTAVLSYSSLDSELSNTLDASMPLSWTTNYSFIGSYIKTNNAVVSQPLADNVVAASFQAMPDPPTSVNILVQVTLQETDGDLFTFRSSASTRAGSQSQVAVADGEFVLTSGEYRK